MSGAKHDIAVIGAGPGGIMAATALRRLGHSVCVFERTRFPRFVIGESLLPSCMDHLEEVGLVGDLETQGYLVKAGVALLEGEQAAEFNFAEQFSEGWGYTWQVKRAEFDQAMVDGARAQGVEVRFECQVTAFEAGEQPLLSWTDAAGAAHSQRFRFVVDASGYGRVISRLLDLVAPSSLPPRKTIFSHVEADIRPAGPRGGYSWAAASGDADTWLWLIPFADGTSSVGVVAGLDYFENMPADPAQCLLAAIAAEPNVAARFPEPKFVFPPKTISAYSANVKTLHGDGYCLVGNAGEFLDPIFSSGIAFAFASARLAADLVNRQLCGESPDWDADYSKVVNRGIDVFRDYIGWWYDGRLRRLFFTDAPASVQEQICSVLAGYVWDDGNPFVGQRNRKIPQLLRLLGSLPEGARSPS